MLSKLLSKKKLKKALMVLTTIYVLFLSVFFIISFFKTENHEMLNDFSNVLLVDENKILEIYISGPNNYSGFGEINIKENAYKIYWIISEGKNRKIHLEFIKDAPTNELLNKGLDFKFLLESNILTSRKKTLTVTGTIKLQSKERIKINLSLSIYSLDDADINSKNMVDCYFTSNSGISFYTTSLGINKRKLKKINSLNSYQFLSYYGTNSKDSNNFIKVYFQENNKVSIYIVDKNGNIIDSLLSGTYKTSINIPEMIISLDENTTLNGNKKDIIFDISPITSKTTYNL
ncbi:MAG: hypothetical protein LBV58_05130 [Acholeplasmatales bacterium]|jgi:hypothetical protein|nr:hypothetical protein [Acholeplasmatales bacterium]